MFETTSIGFIGGGNMGEALIKGILQASLLAPSQVNVFDVSGQRMELLQSTYGIQLSPGIAHLAETSHVLVLAIKPQTMSAVLGELSPHIRHHHLVISIAAGISMGALSGILPEGTPIIRVMPNTPALVLAGASALARGAHVRQEQMDQTMALFKAVGTAVEVDEKWMDTVTGLSGSGPGYVLLLMEAFMDAGVLMGLPRPVARELVIQTFAGTAKMVAETGKHPGELKDLITSPGGTTIRGLQVLEERAVRGAVMRAVEAASLRSQELGKG